MKALAIIPCLNEEATVGKVIKGIKSACPDTDVLVINDGSTDWTARTAKDAGAKVLSFPYNMGIGASMQAGYRYAWDNDYDFAIQVDGDGQHDPREIEKILTSINEDKADIIIGSRFLDKEGFQSTPMRRVGITIFSTVLSILSGKKLTDPTSGFRAVNRKVMRLFAKEYPDDYPEVESLFLVNLFGLRIMEESVFMHSRIKGCSSITALRSIYYMIKVMMTIFLWLVRKKPKLEG